MLIANNRPYSFNSHSVYVNVLIHLALQYCSEKIKIPVLGSCHIGQEAGPATTHWLLGKQDNSLIGCEWLLTVPVKL